MQVNKLTKKQIDKIRKEIIELKEVELPKARERLATAASNGDLSENGDFDSAKKEIQSIKTDIEKKEEILNTSELLTDEEFYSTEVRVGSKVKISIDGEIFEKTIALSSGVDYLESISPKSVLGQALIGKDLMDRFKYKDNKGLDHEVLVMDVM